MSPKEITLPEIGTVKLVRRRGRYIRISFGKEGETICSYPYYSSSKTAIEFLISKTEWILEHRQLIKSKKHPPIDLTNGYHTRMHKLVLMPEIRDDIQINIKKNVITFAYPGHLNIRDKQMQKLIIAAIEKVWLIEAKQYIPIRLKQLSVQFGFTFNNVSIRKTTSRWGSCSFTNNLSLSLYLMHLPDELLDMVLVHELCHTKIKNHQKEFKALLMQCIPNIKDLEREIKKHRVYPF